jgi:hypothetical protein
VNLNVHLPEAKSQRGFKELLNHVYSKDCFRVDKRSIKDFEKIFLHLEEASLKAVETFFKMEGSFVRDGLLIPTTSRDVLEKLQHLELSEFIRKYVVPLSFETFKDKADRVIGVIVEENNEVIHREVDDYLKGKYLTPRRVLRYIIKNNIIAFIVNAEYNDELGLRFD